MAAIEKAHPRLRPRRQPDQRRHRHPRRSSRSSPRSAARSYIKVAKHKAEDARVSIRNIRRQAKDELDKLQKDGEAGEDEVRRAEKELDDADRTSTSSSIDELLKHKEAELLEV